MNKLSIVLVAAGFVGAALVARERARRQTLDLGRLASVASWTLTGALIGGHVLDVLFYRNGEVVKLVGWIVVWRAPIEVLRVWHGWRTLGGILGGTVAALAWQRYRVAWTSLFSLPGTITVECYWLLKNAKRQPLLPFADVLLSALPLLWASYHVSSTFDHGTSQRTLQNGLESLVVLVVLWRLWSKRLKVGTYIALLGLGYPLLRIVGDLSDNQLPVGTDALGLSINQWGFRGIAVLSLVFLIRLRNSVIYAN